MVALAGAAKRLELLSTEHNTRNGDAATFKFCEDIKKIREISKVADVTHGKRDGLHSEMCASTDLGDLVHLQG